MFAMDSTLKFSKLLAHILNNQELFESISLDHLCTTRLLTLNFQAEECFSGSEYVYVSQAEANCTPLENANVTHARPHREYM